MPLGIIEIDDVDTRDFRDVVQWKVVVLNLVTGLGDELFDAQVFGRIPNAVNEFRRVLQAVPFLVKRERAVGDHIDHNSPDVLMFGRMVAVLAGEMFGAEEEGSAIAVNQFLSIEEDEIDAVSRLDLMDVVREFHEEGDAARAVVRADELTSSGVTITVRVGAGVVMAAEEDPFFGFGVTIYDHILHADGFA